MATEEIEWLDEELTNGYTELDAKVKELRSSAGKKLSKGARDDKVRCFCLCIQLVCLASNDPPSSALVHRGNKESAKGRKTLRGKLRHAHAMHP